MWNIFEESDNMVMKTTILFLVMLTFTSCNKSSEGGDTGEEAPIMLEDRIVNSNWVRVVSCVQNVGCNYRAIMIGANNGFFTILDYSKVTPDQDGVTPINQTDMDLVPTGTMSGFAISRVDPNDRKIFSFSEFSPGRMTVCIDSDCRIFDEYAITDL